MSRKPAGQNETNYETAAEPKPAPVVATRDESRANRDDDRLGEGRARRRPFGAPEPKLQARIPAGMVGRWFNDVPGRIQRAIEAGYEFISDDGEVIRDRGGARKEIVGRQQGSGEAMYAYLMAIPQHFYDEDQAAKQREVDKIDDAIRRGVPQQAGAQDRPHFYTPHGQNVIETGVE